MAMRKYLFYEKTVAGLDRNYYYFRLNLVEDAWLTILKLIDPDVEGPFRLIDIPIALPASLPEGEAFNNWHASGTWQLPENVNLLAFKDVGHPQIVYPATPTGPDILVSTTWANEPQVIYTSGNLYRGCPHPDGESPADFPPDADGWYVPALNNFDYALQAAGVRYGGAGYTEVHMEYSWAWDWTEWETWEFHFQNFWEEAVWQYGQEFEWQDDPYFVYSNLEGDASGWLVVFESIAGNHYLNVWVLEPSVSTPYWWFRTETPEFPVSIVPKSIPVILLAVLLIFFIAAPERERCLLNFLAHGIEMGSAQFRQLIVNNETLIVNNEALIVQGGW